MEGENYQFVAEIFALAWRDRCKDGFSRKEAIDMIIDIQPKLTRKQSSRQFSRIILSRAHTKEVLKKTLQKVQSNNVVLCKKQGNLLED